MLDNQAIFETIFNRNFSDTGNTDFLQELTEKHPYFSPAQFFLLEKKQNDAAAFDKQAVKTNIFFNNPHWLNFQLKETVLFDQESFIVEDIIVPGKKMIEIETPEIEATHIVANEINTPVVEESIIMPEVKAIKIEDAEVEATNIETPEIEIPIVEIPAIENIEVDELPDNTDEPELVEKDIEPMHIKLKMPEENLNLDEAMLFEPMHMVDYFASQGIKLSDDMLTGDKLGKQLKSFTEWLKTMKKVHVENGVETPAKTDTNVQVLAENSNARAEILTEAMAEVFARQGKMAKAEEVYQKLSLLNPAKSTYFAAKLQNLKGL